MIGKTEQEVEETNWSSGLTIRPLATMLHFLCQGIIRSYLKNAANAQWLRCHAKPDSASILGFKGASRFALKSTAHPAVGGTPLLGRSDALPSNEI